jgi:hypothetical protein
MADKADLTVKWLDTVKELADKERQSTGRDALVLFWRQKPLVDNGILPGGKVVAARLAYAATMGPLPPAERHLKDEKEKIAANIFNRAFLDMEKDLPHAKEVQSADVLNRAFGTDEP